MRPMPATPRTMRSILPMFVFITTPSVAG
jgi:hypothetical protein